MPPLLGRIRKHHNVRLLPLAIVLAAAAALVAHALVGSSASAANSACDNVPAAKCQAMQDAPRSTPTVSPADVVANGPSQASMPTWGSPSTVQCASTFFSDSTAAALSANFGSLSCFRFAGDDTWVVVGSGINLPNAPAPGGTMIATETCQPGDATCLDATATHAFSAFEVHYPPQPQAVPGEVETTFGNHLIYFRDGACGIVTFDLSSGEWYPHDSADIDSLMSGTASVAPVMVPATTSGAMTLTATPAAPQSTGVCP